MTRAQVMFTGIDRQAKQVSRHLQPGKTSEFGSILPIAKHAFESTEHRECCEPAESHAKSTDCYPSPFFRGILER